MGVTIIDIADKVGVSYTTVSRALNDKKGVSDKMREKIIKAAKEMGYQPNILARGLVSNSSKTIGLIIPDIINPFFPEIARGIEDAASNKGYTVFLSNSNWEIEKEQKCINSLVSNRVDGIIINPNSTDNLEKLQKLDIPIVYVNTKVKDEDVSFIGIDNVSGAKSATQHLIDCGYTKIAYLGGTVKSYSNNMRMKGYKETLIENNFEIDEELIVNSKFNTDVAYDETKKLLILKNPPDAIFAANDIIALGVLHAVDESGIKTPGEFGVIGFDDISEASLYQIQLTTMSLPKYFMGIKAFDLLIDQIENDNMHNAQYIIKPKLVQRKTTIKKI